MEDLNLAAQNVLSALKRVSADKAYFTVEQKEKQEFCVENGELSMLRTLFDSRLSVTVYHHNRKGAASANKLDDVQIENCVRGALLSSESSVEDEAYDIAPCQGEEVFKAGPYEPDTEKLFARTDELLKTIAAEYGKVKVITATAYHEKVHRIYENTNNTRYETFGGRYRIELEVSGNDGEKTTSFIGAGMCLADLGKPFAEYPQIRRALEDAQAQLNTTAPVEKYEGTVIFTPDCFAQFLSFIYMNFVSDSVILEKTSIWLDKIGSRVTDKRISIKLDPFDSRVVGYEYYTHDGFKSEPYYLIKDGTLESFVTSLYVSNKCGVGRAKNLSFNVIMEAGDTPYEDIVRSVKKGIILGGFSGGQPSNSGDFSGVAKNSFLIEDGEIKGALSETMVNGNIAAMLNNVVAVSKETVSDGSMVLPYIAVDGIIISGNI